MSDEDFKLDVFEYLDELRESGTTNMFGAGAYVESEFDVDRPQARELLMEWMKSERPRVARPLEEGS